MKTLGLSLLAALVGYAVGLFGGMGLVDLFSYRWVLEHCLQNLVEELRHIGASQTAVLLDYQTNSDLDDLSRPLSHAALIARYVEINWPLN